MPKNKISTTILILLIFVTAHSVAAGGELMDLHRKLHAGATYQDYEDSMVRAQPLNTDHGIMEIGLERTMCLGSCPAYTLVLKSDGTIRYKGERFVARPGEWTGHIDSFQFHAIASFIKDSRFLELRDSYNNDEITDMPATYTMVLHKRRPKVVYNYGGFGPRTLWIIEQLIDGFLVKTQWQKKSSVRP